MVNPTGELDILRELRARSAAEGGVFWHGADELAVFDPQAAQRVNAANFADLTLPERLVDLLRGRTSPPVSWKQVRAAWSAQLRRLAEPEPVRQLAARMSGLLEQRLDRPLDLVRLAQELSARAFLPAVVSGLAPAGEARLLCSHEAKVAGLLAAGGLPGFRPVGRLRTMLREARAGLVVRGELRGRAAGRRPRRLDLLDPLVDLLPDLGMDRAVGAAAGVLTAVAGPPGAAAACLLYELIRQADWAERLRAELAPIPPEQVAGLAEAPGRTAPLTHRFVKETLRLWSPPLLLTREARTAIDLGEAGGCPLRLAPGQRYLLSPHLLQRDPRHWRDPDAFDPDRWAPADAGGPGPCPAGSYVPFGWAPRSCVGAGLGTAQLMLLCHLFSTRYEVRIEEPAKVRMALGIAALPVGLRGTVRRR